MCLLQCFWSLSTMRCSFLFLSFGGNALEASGWNGTLVTLLMMLLNFGTEYLWDRFVVFNDNLISKMLNHHKNQTQAAQSNEIAPNDITKDRND